VAARGIGKAVDRRRLYVHRVSEKCHEREDTMNVRDDLKKRKVRTADISRGNANSREIFPSTKKNVSLNTFPFAYYNIRTEKRLLQTFDGIKSEQFVALE